MDAPDLLARLCGLIDARRWPELVPLLSDDFECRYVHTGETFDRAAWVRLNAEYPGFDRLIVQDLVGVGDRAVARCHVTGYAEGRLVGFEVASFVTARDGRISRMTEVWTDVAQTPPAVTRLA
jgi:ketosteroid isomerase-like protein